MGTRKQHEAQFDQWEELPDGGRRYFKGVPGRDSGRAIYVKEVDAEERTLSFHQEIYDDQDRLVSVHWKYPVDKGHQNV